MDSSKVEVDLEFPTSLRIYKDGRVERNNETRFVPLSIDAETAVSSKDVTIDTETGLSARLYITKIVNKDKKLPLLIYIHGGGFMIESAFSPLYHHYLSSVVQEAKVVVVSIEYRLAPENPLPIAYDDSWQVIQWVASHSKGEGDDAWLSDCVDFDRVFLAGDSAGGNIVHNMAMRAGEVKSASGLKFLGVILAQPYFWGEERIFPEGSDPAKIAFTDKVWTYACPSTTGLDDPRLNPVGVGAPSLFNLGCSRVLVFVAGKDLLRDRGLLYYETLRKSDWRGVVDVIEADGEDHVFHLFNPTCDEAISMMKSFASFLNQDSTHM